MLDFSGLKQGKVIVYNDQPHVILKCDLVKMNRAKPTKKTKMRNLINGSVLDYTFKSGETVEEADISREGADFMYREDETLFFMTNQYFETVEINSEIMEGKEGYLKEGQKVNIVYFGESPISIEIPVKVSLEVIKTDPAVKGNTVSNVMKDAEMETGIIVKVPAFIENGDKILINTDEDIYVERDTSA